MDRYILRCICYLLLEASDLVTNQILRLKRHHVLVRLAVIEIIRVAVVRERVVARKIVVA